LKFFIIVEYNEHGGFHKSVTLFFWKEIFLFYLEYIRECASSPFREKSPLQWQNELTMPEEQKISLRSVVMPP